MIEIKIREVKSQGWDTITAFYCSIENDANMFLGLAYQTLQECHTSLNRSGFLLNEYTATLHIGGEIHNLNTDEDWCIAILSHAK